MRMSGIAGTQHSGPGGDDDDRSATYTVGFTNDCDYLCDGAADDVQINQAITDLAANFTTGRIVLREGTYDITATIAASVANMEIRGMGWGTILSVDCGGEGIDVTANGVNIAHFALVVAAGAGAVGTRPNGIQVGADYATIEHIYFYGDATIDDGSWDRQNAVRIGPAGDHALVYNCVMTNWFRMGVRIYKGDYNWILCCRIFGNQRDGIYIESDDNANHAIGNQVVNCWISDAQAGIVLETYVDLTIIEHNEIYLTSQEGIRLNQGGDGFYTIVADNVIHEVQREGISVGCDYSVISDNLIYDADSAETGTYYGIKIPDDRIYITVTGNFITSCDAGGIECAGTGHTITGNMIYDNDGDGIYLAASSCSITGNVISANDGDGIEINGGDANTVSENRILGNGAFGLNIDNDADSNSLQANYTSGNISGSVNVGNANCDTNRISDNTLEDGAIADVGTNTRAWLNYDPSANAFVATINAPTVVGGGGGALP